MVQTAPDIENTLNIFFKFIQNYTLVGYNVNFDINFIYDNLLKHNGISLTNNFFDVLKLARNNISNLENHKLETLARYFNLDKQSHRALGDCELCNEVLYKLLAINTNIKKQKSTIEHKIILEHTFLQEEKNTYNNKIYGILALFLGTFGVHKFYAKKYKSGIKYLIFCWTFIPTILSIIDGIKNIKKIALKLRAIFIM